MKAITISRWHEIISFFYKYQICNIKILSFGTISKKNSEITPLSTSLPTPPSSNHSTNAGTSPIERDDEWRTRNAFRVYERGSCYGIFISIYQPHSKHISNLSSNPQSHLWIFSHLSPFNPSSNPNPNLRKFEKTHANINPGHIRTHPLRDPSRLCLRALHALFSTNYNRTRI